MKQNMRSTLPRLALIGLILLTGGAGCATMQGDSSTTPSAAETSKPATPTVTTPAAPVYSGVPAMTPYYPPPDKFDLCGEPVPLQLSDVQERFDKEFTLVVYNHAQVYLWLKRMERYFPMIEEKLRKYNLPDDLKYVAIVESDLQPNVCSPKGAAGPWQFMPSTGSAYGLTQQGSCDRRYDYEKSSDGAFRLLGDLYKRYKSWSLAIAAYNCGDKRIMDEMRNQHVTDYYRLKLPLETERYVIRVLAIKAVLGNPNQYGYNLPKGLGYQELKLDKVNITLTSPVPMQTIATAAGTTYREFKRLNPIYRADEIPAGNRELNLPAGTGKTFEKNFASLRGRSDPSLTTSTSSSTRTDDEDVGVGTKSDSKSDSSSYDSYDSTSDSKPEPVRAAQNVKSESKPEPKAEKSSPKPVPAKRQAKAETYHTVKKGETLSEIAHRYSVSVQEIQRANKIKGSDLTLGQKIKIP